MKAEGHSLVLAVSADVDCRQGSMAWPSPWPNTLHLCQQGRKTGALRHQGASAEPAGDETATFGGPKLTGTSGSRPCSAPARSGSQAAL